MMNTLKEIENKYIYVGSPAIGMKPLFDEIKEEAKKWIEDLKSRKEIITSELDGGGVAITKDSLFMAEDWIEHFFNLNEEAKQCSETQKGN